MFKKCSKCGVNKEIINFIYFIKKQQKVRVPPTYGDHGDLENKENKEVKEVKKQYKICYKCYVKRTKRHDYKDSKNNLLGFCIHRDALKNALLSIRTLIKGNTCTDNKLFFLLINYKKPLLWRIFNKIRSLYWIDTADHTYSRIKKINLLMLIIELLKYCYLELNENAYIYTSEILGIRDCITDDVLQNDDVEYTDYKTLRMDLMYYTKLNTHFKPLSTVNIKRLLKKLNRPVCRNTLLNCVNLPLDLINIITSYLTPDITELKRIKEALIYTELHFKNINQDAYEGVYSLVQLADGLAVLNSSMDKHNIILKNGYYL